MVHRSIIRLPEVKARTGLGRSSIYNMIKTGNFPLPVPIGLRAIGWDSQAIDKWIEERIANVKKPDDKNEIAQSNTA
jgi:prophage regulatory protein